MVNTKTFVKIYTFTPSRIKYICSPSRIIRPNVIQSLNFIPVRFSLELQNLDWTYLIQLRKLVKGFNMNSWKARNVPDSEHILVRAILAATGRFFGVNYRKAVIHDIITLVSVFSVQLRVLCKARQAGLPPPPMLVGDTPALPTSLRLPWPSIRKRVAESCGIINGLRESSQL